MQPKYMHFDYKNFLTLEASDHQELPKWYKKKNFHSYIIVLQVLEVFGNIFLRPTLSSPQSQDHTTLMSLSYYLMVIAIQPFTQHVGPQTIRYPKLRLVNDDGNSFPQCVKTIPNCSHCIRCAPPPRMPCVLDSQKVVAIPNPLPREIKLDKKLLLQRSLTQ